MAPAGNTDVEMGEKVIAKSEDSGNWNLPSNHIEVKKAKKEKAAKDEVSQIKEQKPSKEKLDKDLAAYKKIRNKRRKESQKKKWTQIIADVSVRSDLSDKHQQMLEKKAAKEQQINEQKPNKEKLDEDQAAYRKMRNKRRRERQKKQWAQIIADVSVQSDLSDKHQQMLGKLAKSCHNIAHKNSKEKFANFMVIKCRLGPKYMKAAEELFDILKSAQARRNVQIKNYNGTTNEGIQVKIDNDAAINKDIAVRVKKEFVPEETAQKKIKKEPVSDQESEEEEKKPKAYVARSECLDAMKIFKRYLLQQPDMNEAIMSHMAALESYASRS